MTSRVLVLSAGNGAASNLIRSLQAGHVDVTGAHWDRFVLKKSPAARNFLLPATDDAGFVPALAHLLSSEDIALVLPGHDDDAPVLSQSRDALDGRVFMPAPHVIDLCQDKYRATQALRARGVPSPRTEPIHDLDDVERIFAAFGRPERLWCRIRVGSGSRGAIPVIRPGQARAWIEYWAEMRGVPVNTFTLSEYLPGRDFSAHSLWRDGRPLLTKTCERLSYFVAGGSPSGTSSVSALSKTGQHPEVAAVCVAAVRAIDPRATGVFNFDLKENAAGVPCVTEINAGRFSSGPGLFDLAGKHHMSAVYLRLALGEPIELADEYDAADDVYALRDLDTEPGLFHADQLFEGIEDAREEEA